VLGVVALLPKVTAGSALRVVAYIVNTETRLQARPWPPLVVGEQERHTIRRGARPASSLPEATAAERTPTTLRCADAVRLSARPSAGINLGINLSESEPTSQDLKPSQDGP
jgi:hypothetical protein